MIQIGTIGCVCGGADFPLCTVWDCYLLCRKGQDTENGACIFLSVLSTGEQNNSMEGGHMRWNATSGISHKV